MSPDEQTPGTDTGPGTDPAEGTEPVGTERSEGGDLGESGDPVGTERSEGGDPGESGDPAPEASGATVARPRRARWWRGAGAALVLAGLVGAAAAVDGGSLGRSVPPAAGPGDAAVTAGPSDVTLVDSAALACPGAAADEVPVRVVAARAPTTLLTDDVGPVPGQDAADDAATTTAPSSPLEGPSEGGDDDASSTRSPGGTARLVLSGDSDGSRRLPADEALGVDLAEARAAFVLGEGGAAPGLVGAQLGVGTEAGARGASLTPCVQPAEESWLVGGDGRAGGTERLVLSNPGPDPVTVQVRVWGSEGEATTTGAGGLVVPAGGRVERLLDALAPGVPSPVVSVTATGGPVSAHLHLLVRDGTTDLGSGTVAPGGTPGPATDLVVPAPPPAPEGSEHRAVLRVLPPGDEEAVVDLVALTEDGAVRLPDLVTRVAAGRTAEIDLADLPPGTTGLRVRSDVPVVAAAGVEVLPAEGEPEEASRDDAETTAAPEDEADATAAPADEDGATSDPGGDDADSTAVPPRSREEPLVRPAGELAWVAAGVPSSNPVGIALPDPGVIPAGTSRLVVSAVDATTATVRWLDAEGGTTTEVLDLANDTGRGLPVPADARAVWITTTDPLGEGPGAGVVAAVHVTGADGRGPFVASATLPEVPWTRTVTTVRPAVP